MSDKDEIVNMIETTMQHAGDRERFKRTRTMKRKGFDSVNWLGLAAAFKAKKPIELVIEAKLLLTTDEEEEIFDFAVCYTEPLDGMPHRERKEFANKPIIYDWEEFSRHIGLEITDLLIQTGRHGRIKITIMNDGSAMDEPGFMKELDPWYESPDGKKQVEIFLRREREKESQSEE